MLSIISLPCHHTIILLKLKYKGFFFSFILLSLENIRNTRKVHDFKGFVFLDLLVTILYSYIIIDYLDTIIQYCTIYLIHFLRMDLTHRIYIYMRWSIILLVYQTKKYNFIMVTSFTFFFSLFYSLKKKKFQQAKLGSDKSKHCEQGMAYVVLWIWLLYKGTSSFKSTGTRRFP